MIDVQYEIGRIVSNSLPEAELLEYLDSEFLLIRANVIMSVARRRLDSAQIIDKLDRLARLAWIPMEPDPPKDLAGCGHPPWFS
ncbi:MAG: hypothetical protein R3E01_14815 [Pirellulaceae bacterium]